jgi:hypothetical protein
LLGNKGTGAIELLEVFPKSESRFLNDVARILRPGENGADVPVKVPFSFQKEAEEFAVKILMGGRSIHSLELPEKVPDWTFSFENRRSKGISRPKVPVCDCENHHTYRLKLQY